MSKSDFGLEEQVQQFLSRVVYSDWIKHSGMTDTPSRVVKLWKELNVGYTQNAQEILSQEFENDGLYDGLVLLKGIDFYSVCEHHLLPFYGKAYVGYIVRDKVVGISKLARVVECFSRRLQVQERMTQQIAEAVAHHLDPLGVGVIVKGKHLCMMMRGIQKQDAVMVTSSMYGALREEGPARSEFIRICGL